MADTVFDKAFANVVGIEAGYVNDPQDPGGETKYGISKRSYPNVDIKNLTLDGAKQIYMDDFWLYLRCDRMNPSLAEFVFDFAINSGRETVAEKLQQAVGTLPDGKIGPATLAALNQKPVLQVVRLLFVERLKIMASSAGYPRFKNGWFARVFDVTARFFTNGGN